MCAMTETRQNPKGSLVATFRENANSSHPPAHRYTVTLKKHGRTVSSTIHRHVRTQAAARELSKKWTTTGKP